MDHTVEYYRQRASEYEKIYAKPERQETLSYLKQYLKNALQNHDVLEIACGTGYWTQIISSTAHSVLATDINEEMLQIAKEKKYPLNNVNFILDDAYFLDKITGSFTACFVGFLYSHIPKQKLRSFFDSLHKRWSSQKNEGKTQIIFVDNLYVEGSSTPITYTDEYGNTYQERCLENKNVFQILKNFPTEKELFSMFKNQIKNPKFLNFQYYWCFTYEVG